MNVSVTFTGTVSQITELLNSVSGLAIEPVAEQPSYDDVMEQDAIVPGGVTHVLSATEQVQTPLMESAGGMDETPPPAANAPEVDANGDVWDGRIHSGGKNILKSGLWRKKKGVGQDEYDAVIAENRAVGTPPMPAGDETPPPAASAPTPPPAASAPVTFQEFMVKLSNSSQTNPAIQPAIPRLVEELQGEFNIMLASIADIQGQPEMINRANEIMHRDGLFV